MQAWPPTGHTNPGRVSSSPQVPHTSCAAPLPRMGSPRSPPPRQPPHRGLQLFVRERLQGRPACLPFLVLYKDRLLLTRLKSIFVRKKKHLFSTPVPPLLGRPGSRRCPGSFLQYYRCSGSLALPLRARAQRRGPVGGAGGPSPALLSHPPSPWLRVGRARPCKPCSSIWKTPAGPGAAAGSHQARLAIPGPQLSGVTGSFCACSALCSTSVGFSLAVFPILSAAAPHLVLLRPSGPRVLDLAPPLGPTCGFWGPFCRAPMGFALREGLGAEGAREPPESELRRGA